jgi:ascorbate-specific PTS system EIIC-type component UlaA
VAELRFMSLLYLLRDFIVFIVLIVMTIFFVVHLFIVRYVESRLSVLVKILLLE